MKLEDENFALKFELETLADLTVSGKAERWVPGFMWQGIDVEHRSRYELACSLVQNKKVLDVACGSGYGSYLLATEGKAMEVLGVDIDEKAVRYGGIRYPHQNVKRVVQDVQQLHLLESFDVVVSFETIEHLTDFESFLRNVRAALKEKGILIISTPVVNKTRTKCDNPFHQIEWSFEDFGHLISKYFSIEKKFVQSIQMQKREKTGLANLFSKISDALRGPVQQKELDRTPILFAYELDVQKVTYGYQILIAKKK